MQNKKIKGIMFWIVGGMVVVAVAGILVALNWVSTSGYDYSEMSYTEAFDALHAQFVAQYPFTEWKQIDWDELYAETAPLVAQAEADQDKEAFYLAVRQYGYAIPDNHVAVGGDDFGLRDKAIGGGYGISVIGLDDGRVIVYVLLENSPAAQSGLEWGAEILEWNGLPVHEALAQTEILWASSPPATLEGRLIEQYRYLTRAPIGTEISLTFRNPGEDAPQTVSLAAVDDQLEALQRTLPVERDVSAIVTSPIQAEILPCGYGYIKITGFMPTLGGINMAKIVDRAVEDFIEADVWGIIFDVRNNGGGIDTLIPEIVGHFYTQDEFYEYVSFRGNESGEFIIDDAQTLVIEPREPYFDGPVVVLVGKDTMSTAEGIPLAVQPLSQGYVVGIYSTSGAFAVGEPGENLYRLPEGIGVNFLKGRSLDADGVIQVDADANGEGGVQPDIRVPLTYENVYAMYVENVDIVLDTAIEWLDGMN